MTAFGILGYGAYIPRKRMSRSAIYDAVGWAQPSLKGLAKGARAFGAWDEDALTIAVAAARNATRISKKTPDAICFASTTAPFLDRSNAGVIAAALDLPRELHAIDSAGSQRAASSALINISKQNAGATLLAAADCRPTKPASAMEMLSGDAGAALLFGEGSPIAEIACSHSIRADMVDHYRTSVTKTDYVLEERWYREEGIAKLAPQAVSPLLDRAGVNIDQINHLISPLPNPALANDVAKSLKLERSIIADSLFETCGHAGAAQPLLMLAHVLENAAPDQWILMTVFGQGCDAILIKTSDAIRDFPSKGHLYAQLKPELCEENYTRFISARGAIDIDWGMRAERDNRTAQTVAFDKSRDVYGLVGGLCATCETPQFPKARRCVNPDCTALDTQTDYPFSNQKAVVKSFTEDWLAFTREPPLVYGNVAFEGGGNLFMEMTGFQPGDISVGTPVEMQFRIKDIDAARGFHRYFWKAAPATGGAHG